MPPTRIATVGFVSGDGGDAAQMLELARGVRATGGDVEVIVPATPANERFAARCRAAGVPARCTELLGVTGPGRRQSVRSLRRLLRSIDADVLHVHAGDSSLPRTMLLALLVPPRRCVVATLHSPYRSIDPRGARARTWAAGARFTLRAVVSPSDHGSAFQRECGVPEQLVVTVRNAVDTAAAASGDGARVRAELGLADDVPLVVVTGRLDHQKRPVDAVAAFARVLPTVPSAVLAVVGDGDERGAVLAEARRLGVEEQVVLAGRRDDVPDWLAAATVWLFPTERENFSLALLEAMAAGCPIVATSCPGNDEVLVDGANALTYPVADVDAAAAALARLLADAGMRQRLAAGARTTAAANTVAGMVDAYWRVYARCPGSTR